MAGSFTLEDGRVLWASTLGVGGMIGLIADEIQDRPKLKRWLTDVSNRCAGFCDLDMRSLTLDDQTEVWAAAKRALLRVLEIHGPEILARPDSWAAPALERLLEMHSRVERGEPPLLMSDMPEVRPHDGSLVDLDADIWMTDED